MKMRKPKAVTDTIAVLKAAPVVQFGEGGRYLGLEPSNGLPEFSVRYVAVMETEATRLIAALTRTDARTRNDPSSRKKRPAKKVAKKSTRRR
jgi:hypothetical protein